MNTKFQAADSGSLGEPRRPRRLEEVDRYGIERSIQVSSRSTILIAEDDEDSRFMMRALLEMKGYRVLEARSGGEAMETALSKQPDLVLLDLELPGLDGLCYSISQVKMGRNLPGREESSLEQFVRPALLGESVVGACQGIHVRYSPVTTR